MVEYLNFMMIAVTEAGKAFRHIRRERKINWELRSELGGNLQLLLYDQEETEYLSILAGLVISMAIIVSQVFESRHLVRSKPPEDGTQTSFFRIWRYYFKYFFI